MAEYLDLNPATISVVLNDVPGRSIPEPTRERIREAARRFKYQPSFVARSLRNRRTQTIGILVPVLSDGYQTEVMAGIGDYLLENDYFYFIAHHHHRADLIEQYPRMLIGRGSEGIIGIDTQLEHHLPVPVVAVAGHKAIPGITNVILDHNRAAELALKHLYQLGHREIAFMRGQPYSSDSEARWASILKCAANLGLRVNPELTIHLELDITSPELGYPPVRKLLQKGRHFTAIFGFNDMAAIGAMRAIHEAGLRIPEDVSVIGFDDIEHASFHTPSLTTVRQPLHKMGRLAAETLLNQIHSPGVATKPEILVKPQLMARESTGPCSEKAGRRIQSKAKSPRAGV
ncbi:MAG: substrate-binding domain-containing protein [Acidobacteriaceae bacterium]